MRKKGPSIDKTALIMELHSMLHYEAFETQEEICHALRKKGFEVTQVTISRLMNKLGAIKMNENQRMVYRLPVEIISVTADNSLTKLVLNITHNEMLIVIRVTPGAAQLVARLLDQRPDLGILGTIAGDDTILVVPEKVSKIGQLVKDVSTLLLGK